MATNRVSYRVEVSSLATGNYAEWTDEEWDAHFRAVGIDPPSESTATRLDLTDLIDGTSAQIEDERVRKAHPFPARAHRLMTRFNGLAQMGPNS